MSETALRFRQFAWLYLIFVSLSCAGGCGGGGDPGTNTPNGDDANSRSAITEIASEPLAPRSAGTASQLFASVPPEHSGVDFVNKGAVQKTNARGEPINFGTNSAQHTAEGVSIGDYDGDKLPDIFLTRAAGGNRLYRNLGDLRFSDVSAAAGIRNDGMWGMGATFVDIDNDGDLDLYVCGYDCPNQLYVNRGDGTFIERAAEFGLAFQGASVIMSFMDYDRDGDLDGYLLTSALDRLVPKGPIRVRHNPAQGWVEVPEENQEGVGAMVKPNGTVITFAAGQFDHLFENRGPNASGAVQFADVSKVAGISGTDIGLSATWFDYDGDAWPDLYVANDFYGPDRLYRNNRDGTFSDVLPSAVPHTPWYSMGSDAGDLNNDGKFDLIASDMSGTTHYNRQIGLGDIAAERWFLNYPSPPQYMRNAVYLNAGAGRFMEVAYLAGLANSDWTWSIKLADLDCDGWLDVYVTNGMTRDAFNSDLKEQEKLVATKEEAEKFWQEKPVKRDRNMAFRNDGDLRFTNMASAWGLDHLGVSFGAAWGDLDSDGDLDLVVSNYDEQAAIYRNHASEAHSIKLRLKGTTSNRWGIGSVVSLDTKKGNQVRQLKLASGYMSADEPLVYFGLGKATVIRRLAIEWPSGHKQIFENLAADKFYTVTEPVEPPPEASEVRLQSPLFARSNALGTLKHTEKFFADFTREPLLPYRLSQLGPGMAWGDADGDGDEDLYLSGASGQVRQLVLRQPDGTFRVEIPKAFDEDRVAEDMAPLFFDADADGDQDLYVVSSGLESAAADRLYINDGQGQFTRAAEELSADANAHSRGVVCASDFDRDGDLDVFVGGRCIPGQYPLPPESRLLRNTGGQFVSVERDIAPDLAARGMVTSALWSDADNDGWIDLLVTYEWGPVRLFHNERGQRLVDVSDRAGLTDRLGWWNGIAGRDLDHDGDIDYAVTNIGLNTKYEASAEHPVRMYYGDFDGGGRRHIVEAVVTDEGLLPLRDKSAAQNAMPFLRQRFPTFHSYAAATLPEIYTDDALQRSQVFEANTMETGILLNNGDGRFEFRPLPRLAQVAPAFGVALEDVNADGHTDIYLVQNFLSPQPETGRMDGGLSLLLNGDGKGTFTSVWPDASGLIVPGDAKSLTVTDLNGDQRPDFVVGVNSGDVLAFENRCSRGNPLVVRLSDEPGNPTAIGAQVTVLMSNGSNQAAEVTAGGGYLSQNGGALFFGLGESQVKQIDVRWPDGTTSVHEAPADNRVEIKKPDGDSQGPAGLR
jgi:enediyne biosynthesis protein E4